MSALNELQPLSSSNKHLDAALFCIHKLSIDHSLRLHDFPSHLQTHLSYSSPQTECCWSRDKIITAPLGEREQYSAVVLNPEGENRSEHPCHQDSNYTGVTVKFIFLYFFN